MGQKLSNIHCLVDKIMNMFESYLSKTYFIISGASSCRCIGIAGCLQRELYLGFGKNFGYLIKLGGEGA
jgi:hypothetical protein